MPFTDADIAALGIPIGYEADEGAGCESGSRLMLQVLLDNGRASLCGLTPRSIRARARPLVRRRCATHLLTRRVLCLWPRSFCLGECRRAITHGCLGNPCSRSSRRRTRFIMNDENLLEVRSVRVAHATNDMAYLSSGISEGDRVIVSPIRNPVPGWRYRLFKKLRIPCSSMQAKP